MANHHEDYDDDDDGSVEDNGDFSMGSSPPPHYAPPGAHSAEFIKYELIKTMYGPKVKWIFKLLAKKQNGGAVDGLGPLKAGDSNASGKILRGLTGKPLDPEANVKLKKLYGTKGKVILKDGKAAGTCNVVDFYQEGDDDDDE